MQVDPGVTVIGTQSAGANGNVSEFVLPGGIRSCFSGLGWYYPGGWCVQLGSTGLGPSSVESSLHPVDSTLTARARAAT